MVQLNSPEDERRCKFADIPSIAQDCAQNKVKALQLVGWADGGQDQDSPFRVRDPKLGSIEDFKNVIKKCQLMGVKVILFVNLHGLTGLLNGSVMNCVFWDKRSLW